MVEERTEAEAGEKPLLGLTFVVTGTLPNFSREQAEERIKLAGGRVTGSVSAKTSYVLAGESPGGKIEKARKLSIPVIDEAEWLSMLGESAPS